jgi:hypothetical protein
MTATAAASKPLTPTHRRWLIPSVVVALLMVSALAVTLLNQGPQRNSEDLDPANPGYSGAQGLAHVLGEHGVKVTVVRSQGELLDQVVDGATTVAITGTGSLSGRTAHTALVHAASSAGLILLDPDPEVTKGMGLPVASHLADLVDLAANCQGTDVGEAFRLARADRAYLPTAPGTTAPTCFPDKIGGGGAMVSLPAAVGRPPVVMLGDESLIINGAILDSDNAAIALHLFGRTSHLLWYVPSQADIAAADGTSRSITPSWFQPGLTLGTSAVVLLCLWRGRRLGRLVTEPLPVIVRAVETTESRGRLYRKARDRSRALAVLQQATTKRLATFLGLSASTALSNVAAASAAASGRDYEDVMDLLESPAAHDDSSLLELASTLRALEKEVRGT